MKQHELTTKQKIAFCDKYLKTKGTSFLCHALASYIFDVRRRSFVLISTPKEGVTYFPELMKPLVGKKQTKITQIPNKDEWEFLGGGVFKSLAERKEHVELTLKKLQA